MNIVAMTVCAVDFFSKTGKRFLGGNSLNFAAQAKASSPESRVSLIGAVGRDENGARVRAFLEKRRILTDRLYSLEGKTATNELFNDESGERFGVPGAWDGGVYEGFTLSEDDWKFALGCDVIATHGNNPNFPELLRRKDGNALLSVDFLDALNDVPMKGRLAGIGIALISAPRDKSAAYKALSDTYNVLIVQTMGAKGSLAFHQGKVFQQAALPVPKVVDTTGCGDSYLGAFTVEYAKTRDVPAAMRAGAMAASLVLSYFGGVGE
jgi:fructoselysine 6-kinase